MTPLLTYFNVRGRAEIVRLILEETATPHRERCVDVAEWPTLKPTLPFGQLPTYEDGDLLIVQNHAICRYLARKHDLQGADEREHIRCDIVEEAFVDTLKARWEDSCKKCSQRRNGSVLRDARGCRFRPE
jgi:glutathione S-transferase